MHDKVPFQIYISSESELLIIIQTLINLTIICYFLHMNDRLKNSLRHFNNIYQAHNY